MFFHEALTAEEIDNLEMSAFNGRITVISKLGKEFDSAIRDLNNSRIIGFDTETKPVFQANAHHGMTALLQLSNETNAYLFRLNTLGLPQELADILSSDCITKVGAAVHDDIRGLQKYLPFEPSRFMDLQQFAEEYGIKDKSVKKLAAIILKTKVSKSQQLSNWEAVKLSEAQQLYAATDAWICLQMYKALLVSPRNEEEKPCRRHKLTGSHNLAGASASIDK